MANTVNLSVFTASGDPIINHYRSLVGVSSFLRFPTSDEFQVGSSGRRSNFQNGYITFSFITVV